MKLYGILARFTTADALMAAVKRARTGGFTDVEAYSPFPVEGLAEATGFSASRVPLLVLLGGCIGGAGGYFMQWYSAVISYPINSGGRPLHSWPAFIPATFELAVLGAALAGALGMLILNGLPRLYHPLFNVEGFDLASRNGFFICLRAATEDESRRARAFLLELQPADVWDVPQ